MSDITDKTYYLNTADIIYPANFNINNNENYNGICNNNTTNNNTNHVIIDNMIDDTNIPINYYDDNGNDFKIDEDNSNSNDSSDIKSNHDKSSDIKSDNYKGDEINNKDLDNVLLKDIFYDLSENISKNIVTNISNHIADNIIANKGIVDNNLNITNIDIDRTSSDSFSVILQNLLSKKIGSILNTSNILLPNNFKNEFKNDFKNIFDKNNKTFFELPTEKEVQKEPDTPQTAMTYSLSPRDNISDGNYDKKNIRKNELMDIIVKSRKRINDNLFLISAKYDNIYYKYNAISISIMIISTISTLIEAIRLTMIEYIKENAILINIDTFTLIMNTYLLAAGTTISILSSLVRFKNYREIMEKLKNIQNIYIKHKLNYEKQERDMILYFDSNNELDNEKYQNFKNILTEYNKEIKEINFFEDIRTNQIIKLNKIKALYDIQLKDIIKDKELKSLEIDKKYELKEISIINDNELKALQISRNKMLNVQKIENKMLKKNENENENENENR